MTLLFQQMCLFVLGHELGHIRLGHCDRELPTRKEGRWQEELEADAFGAWLLLRWLDRLRHADPAHGEARYAWGLAASVTAVTLLFGVHEAVGIAGSGLGAPKPGYPPARLRSEAFREGMVGEFDVPASVFTDRLSLLPAPMDWVDWLPALAQGVDWPGAGERYEARRRELGLGFFASIVQRVRSPTPSR